MVDSDSCWPRIAWDLVFDSLTLEQIIIAAHNRNTNVYKQDGVSKQYGGFESLQNKYGKWKRMIS